MENKSKNTSEISQWIDNYLHISLDTEEYVEVRNFLILCIYNHRTTKTNQKYPSVNL